jgi:uncharacterized YccA/Bax inhibitor family protein
LNANVFRIEQGAYNVAAMTVQGTAIKCGFLLAICVAGAGFAWEQTVARPDLVGRFAMGGALGGFVLALITIFKPNVAPFTSPFYAALEGLFLGAVSALFDAMYPGIVPQAVTLTFGTLAAMLVAYMSGVIRATENFKLGVVAATGGIALAYFLSMVLGMFGVVVPYIHQGGPIGIGISVFVVIIAALNLVLDFDFIEQGAAHGAPKYLEWYGAFSLMVTLVWLYIEFLRLLAKLQSSRD